MKIQLQEKRYIFETKKNDAKVYTTVLKPVSTLLNFQFCIFWTDWDITRQRALRSGRVAPGRAGSTRTSIIWSKRIFNCSINHVENTISFRDIALFQSPIWLWDEARYSISLRFVPHRSQLLVKDFIQFF